MLKISAQPDGLRIKSNCSGSIFSALQLPAELALGEIVMKKVIIFFTFLFFAGIVSAAEEQEACVKHRKEFGWSNGYSVMATVISGSDLNSAVGSFSRFESFATYAVVFWGVDQASIFKLPSMSMGSLPMFEEEVEDQEGRRWKIKEGHDFCY